MRASLDCWLWQWYTSLAYSWIVSMLLRVFSCTKERILQSSISVIFRGLSAWWWPPSFSLGSLWTSYWYLQSNSCQIHIQSLKSICLEVMRDPTTPWPWNCLSVSCLNAFEPLKIEVLCVKWIYFLNSKCHIFVKPLKLKLRVCIWSHLDPFISNSLQWNMEGTWHKKCQCPSPYIWN